MRHLDIVARRVIGRLRRLDGGGALIAAGFGHLERRARSKTLGAQFLLTIEVETRAFCRGVRRSQLRLRLLDRAFLRGDLAADAIDGGLLGRDPAPRSIDRDAIVAVVDLENDVAGVDQSVVARQNRRDMAGHPRAEHGVVGAHIGVVGADVEASDQKIVGRVRHSGERQQRGDAHQHEFALAGFRRGGLRRSAGAAAGASVDGCSISGVSRRLARHRVVR